METNKKYFEVPCTVGTKNVIAKGISWINSDDEIDYMIYEVIWEGINIAEYLDWLQMCEMAPVITEHCEKLFNNVISDVDFETGI